MKTAYRFTQNIYLSHYDTAIKSECFCIGNSNFVQESRHRKRWKKKTESRGKF